MTPERPGGRRSPAPSYRHAALAGLLAVVLAVAVVPAVAVESRQPTAGSRTGDDPLFPGLGNGGYDVARYDVRLTWQPRRDRVEGVARITGRTTKPLSRFSLDYRGPEVTSVRVAGRRAAVRREGAELVVTPARPLRGARQRFVVTVRYAGTPTTVTDPDGSSEGWFRTEDGAVALGEPLGTAAWVPVNGINSDKARWQVTLDTPRGTTGVSNGRLQRHRTTGSREVWAWRGDRPMSAYLAFVAIGDYDRFDSEVDGVGLTSFVDPDLDATEALATMSEVYTWAADRFGPHPFDQGGLVLDDVGSGYALETQTRPVYDGQAPESTIVHETAHQWFGNSVTPRGFGDIWLNEGFATYAEWLWEAEQGTGGPAEELRRALDRYPAGSRFWETPPQSFTDPADLFSNPVYLRGSMTLAALERRIGERTLARVLRRWADRYEYGVVTSRQFERLAARVSGADLDGFFDAWLRAPERPTGW